MSDDSQESDGGGFGWGRSFSIAAFVALAALSAAGMALSSTYLPFGWYAVPFVVGFLAGVATPGRVTIEAGAAGLVTAGVAGAVFDPLLTLFGLGSYVVIAAGAGGFVTAALGAHFGSDLRDGLTREL